MTRLARRTSSPARVRMTYGPHDKAASVKGPNATILLRR
jgi:hypothetical protein